MERDHLFLLSLVIYSLASLSGISPEAAQLITSIEEITGGKIVGVGLDSPSVDHGPSKDFMTHRILYGANIYSLENVADMNLLPSKGFDVMVMPMKIRGGSGAPTRITVFLPGSNGTSSATFISGDPMIIRALIVIVMWICLYLF